MAIAPVLKTGARKGLGVRVPHSPPSPSFPFSLQQLTLWRDANAGKFQPAEGKGTTTLITDATRMFIENIKAHLPSKLKTSQRYQQVMNHFERLPGTGGPRNLAKEKD